VVTKVLKEASDIEGLSRFIAARGKFPMTITIIQGAPRSDLQNRLAQRWFTDISRQLGDQSHDHVRAFCKLTIGIPILRAENEAFKAQYDRVLKHLSYEEKLEAVRVFDLPVTRLMSTKQMGQFMDEMQRFWAEKSVRLTDPEALKWEEGFA
jgi:hypothetical protein